MSEEKIDKTVRVSFLIDISVDTDEQTVNEMIDDIKSTFKNRMLQSSSASDGKGYIWKISKQKKSDVIIFDRSKFRATKKIIIDNISQLTKQDDEPKN